MRKRKNRKGRQPIRTKHRSRPRKKRKYVKRVIEVKNMEQIYKVINKVQSDNKKLKIFVDDNSNYPIIENILKDSSLDFEIIEKGSGRVYIITPSKKTTLTDLNLDEFEDEFIEDGQLF